MESIMRNGIKRLIIGAPVAIGIVALSASTIGSAVALTAEATHRDGGYAGQNSPQQEARPESDCEDAASPNTASSAAIEEASQRGLVAVCGRPIGPKQGPGGR